MRRTITLLLLAFIVFVLFAHLDDHQLEYYDEARRGINAIEMARGDSHPLVPTYAGEADHFGVKPPLLVWLQALFVKLLGIGELAIRLPSALASLALTALLMWWGRKAWEGSTLTGLLGALILFCSAEWMVTHGARSGDYDALLVLFLTAQVAFAHRWVISGRRKYVLQLGLAVLLAGYTKGIAGGFLLPGIGIWLLTTASGRRMLLRPDIYLSVGTAILLVAAYYPIREAIDPGYIDWVRHHEWGGRFRGYGSTHEPAFFFYVTRMVNDNGFTFFFALFPFAATMAFLRRDALHPARMCTIVAVVFLFILSLAQTKLYWYKSPAMPLIALVVAGALVRIGDLMSAGGGKKPWGAVALFAVLFATPMSVAVDRAIFPRHFQHTPAHKFPYRDFTRQAEVKPPYTILARGYNPNARFEYERLRARGLDVRLKQTRNEPFPSAVTTAARRGVFEPDERLLVCQQETWDYVSQRYETFDHFVDPPCKLVYIRKAKPGAEE